MEDRLIPVNAVLALVARDGGWFENLAEQGFRLHALELDVQSQAGVIRADAVLYRLDPDLILLVECKSGRNVEARQAQGYAAADMSGIRVRSALPNQLVDRPAVPVAPLYVCLDEHRDDIVTSLTMLELEATVLVVGPGSAMLDGPVPAGLERFSARDARLGLPPTRIRLDRHSPPEELMSVIVQRVVAGAAQGLQHLEIDDIAHDIFGAHWVHMSVNGRRDLVATLKRAASQLTRGELRDFLRVEGSSSVPDRIVILDSPAGADPRGAPQRWQALMRRVARDLGREGPSIIERQPQLSLDDLAIEAEAAPDPLGDDPTGSSLDDDV
jgi:hypothetical protein